MGPIVIPQRSRATKEAELEKEVYMIKMDSISELIESQTILKIPLQFARWSTHRSMCLVCDHTTENGITRFQLPRQFDVIEGFELEPDHVSVIDSITLEWRGFQLQYVRDGNRFTLPEDPKWIATWDLCLEYIIVHIKGNIDADTKLNVVGKFVNRETFGVNPLKHLASLYKIQFAM
jgi:hypothetical protein